MFNERSLEMTTLEATITYASTCIILIKYGHQFYHPNNYTEVLVQKNCIVFCTLNKINLMWVTPLPIQNTVNSVNKNDGVPINDPTYVTHVSLIQWRILKISFHTISFHYIWFAETISIVMPHNNTLSMLN